MPRTKRTLSQYTQIRRRFALIVTFAIFTNLLAPFAYSASQGTTARAVAAALPVQAQSEFVRRVPLVANDVIYNPADQTLYASVPSRVGDIGARLLEKALVTKGWKPGKDLKYFEAEGAEHMSAWAARVESILTFLFPPRM